MRILQLANGYLGNRLYKNLFCVQQKLGIENLVYVPVKNTEAIPRDEPENVWISPCFSQLDRILFFRKQKKMLRDLEKWPLAQIDVVHAHTVFSAGYAARQIQRKYGIPYIVAVRNTDVNVFFKNMLHLRATGVDILRHADKIIFLSPKYRDNVLQRYVPQKFKEEIRKKCCIIPNGIADLFLDNKGLAKALPVDRIRLIHVGEISANKNLELTIEAIKLLRKEQLPVCLKVVGEIKEEKYHRLINSNDFIEYHPRCALEEVLGHLRSADIFVMPSHTETFGLVYAEAMSQGLPVVYTRGQGFDGQFEDGTVGFAVSDHNAEEIASVIKEIITDYGKLSANCIRLVDGFRWEGIANTYKTIYKECTGEMES